MENKNPFLRKWQEIHKLKKASWNNGIRINLRLRISTGEKNLVVATPKYCFDVDIMPEYLLNDNEMRKENSQKPQNKLV